MEKVRKASWWKGCFSPDLRDELHLLGEGALGTWPAEALRLEAEAGGEEQQGQGATRSLL